MEWSLDRKRPICPQLCEQLCIMIAAGKFHAGCRLPSVRDIALSAGVNPNTVQKSLETLAEQGVVYPERGSGWFVSDTKNIAAEITNDVIRQKTAADVETMKALGMDLAQIIEYVKEWKE